MKVLFYHPGMSMEHWGFIPSFLREDDPRPVKEQFNERYIYGGWNSQKGFTKDEKDGLHYPGYPVKMPVSELFFRDERILLYPYSYVCIIQQDGSWEVCRMD